MATTPTGKNKPGVSPGTKAKKINRPDNCISPNEAGKELNCTGEAVKQWIYKGRLRAAKAPNRYWWIKREDLDAFLASRNNLEFKFHGPAVDVEPTGK